MQNSDYKNKIYKEAGEKAPKTKLYSSYQNSTIPTSKNGDDGVQISTPRSRDEVYGALSTASKYLMWDIDGTLILSGGAGKEAMLKVIKNYYFLDSFEFKKSLAGRTDSDIIKNVVTRLRGHCSSADAASLLIRYHMELPKMLPLHQGRVLKNVEKTLAYFQQPDSKYRNCLLTGNTRTGAQLKLRHFGLEQYFDFNHSVFGEISEYRADLARIIWQRLYIENPELRPHDLIFIGDTPSDAQCASAIDARCLIVLEGSSYKPEDFTEHKPWKFIDCLPDDPSQLEAMLDEE